MQTEIGNGWVTAALEKAYGYFLALAFHAVSVYYGVFHFWSGLGLPGFGSEPCIINEARMKMHTWNAKHPIGRDSM